MIDHAQWLDSIVRASWQGALLVLATWMVLRLLKKAPAKTRSWIWPIVLTKFVLVAVIIWELPVLASPEIIATETIQLQQITFPTEVAAVQQATAWPLEKILFAIWLFGVALIVAKALREYAVLSKIASKATIASDRTVKLCERVTDKHASVRVHPDVPMPLVIGVFNPVVLLPSKLESELSDEHLIMVLAHEVAHIQRRDVLTAVYVFICQTLFFFHPAVWVVKREWQIARESACDQYAIKKTNTNSRDYADMLIKVSVGAQRSPAFALSAVPAYKTLHRRIDEMKNTNIKSGSAKVAWLIAIALVGAAALPFALVQKKPLFGAGVFEGTADKTEAVTEIAIARSTVAVGISDIADEVDIVDSSQTAIAVADTVDVQVSATDITDGQQEPRAESVVEVRPETALASPFQTGPRAASATTAAPLANAHVATSSIEVAPEPTTSSSGIRADAPLASTVARSATDVVETAPEPSNPLASSAPTVRVGSQDPFATTVVPRKRTKTQDEPVIYVTARRSQSSTDRTAKTSKNDPFTGYIAKAKKDGDFEEGMIGIAIHVEGDKYMITASKKAKITFGKDASFVQIVETDGKKYWVSVGGSKAKGQGTEIKTKVKVINGNTYHVASAPRPKK